MKTCNKCGIEKPLTDFKFKNKAKGTYQSYCTPCKKEIDRQYYLTNPERGKYVRANAQAMKDSNRAYIWDYFKANPCPCGETDPRVLEFDHIDPTTKKGNLAELVGSHSLEVIKAEIAKCRVLCANCHRRHTYEQFGWKTF